MHNGILDNFWKEYTPSKVVDVSQKFPHFIKKIDYTLPEIPEMSDSM
jgi:hypothetical protein